MTDLERDLRATAYSMGVTIELLGRVGRTLAADALADELESVKLAIARMEATSSKMELVQPK